MERVSAPAAGEARASGPSTEVIMAVLEHLMQKEDNQRTRTVTIFSCMFKMTNKAYGELMHQWVASTQRTAPYFIGKILLDPCPYHARFCADWISHNSNRDFESRLLPWPHLLQAIVCNLHPVFKVRKCSFGPNAPHVWNFANSPAISVPHTGQVVLHTIQDLFTGPDGQHPPPSGLLFSSCRTDLPDSTWPMYVTVQICTSNPDCGAIDWTWCKRVGTTVICRTSYTKDMTGEHHTLKLLPGDALRFEIPDLHVKGDIYFGCGEPLSSWTDINRTVYWLSPSDTKANKDILKQYLASTSLWSPTDERHWQYLTSTNLPSSA